MKNLHILFMMCGIFFFAQLSFADSVLDASIRNGDSVDISDNVGIADTSIRDSNIVDVNDDFVVRDSFIRDSNAVDVRGIADTSIRDSNAVDVRDDFVVRDSIVNITENDDAHEDTVMQKDKRNISYTGAIISLAIPGGGQLYQRRYVAGSLFLAAEVGALAYSAYWFQSADDFNYNVSWWRDSVNAARDREDTRRADSLGVFLARYKFEEREARYTAYSALSWAVGLHLYNFLDALEFGGARSRGGEKNPTTAGLLSAVPFLSLGQYYNGRPGKAGLLAATQTSLAVMAYGHHRQMETASREFNRMRDPDSDVYEYRSAHLNFWRNQYDRNFSRRNTYLWVGLAAYLYTIFDAIVDAHLNDFERRINVGTDLAVELLPGGGAVRIEREF